MRRQHHAVVLGVQVRHAGAQILLLSRSGRGGAGDGRGEQDDHGREQQRSLEQFREYVHQRSPSRAAPPSVRLRTPCTPSLVAARLSPWGFGSAWWGWLSRWRSGCRAVGTRKRRRPATFPMGVRSCRRQWSKAANRDPWLRGRVFEWTSTTAG